MVRPLESGSQEPVKDRTVPPATKDSGAMYATINRVKGLALLLGAGHPPSFDSKAQGPRLDDLFHRKIG